MLQYRVNNNNSNDGSIGSCASYVAIGKCVDNPEGVCDACYAKYHSKNESQDVRSKKLLINVKSEYLPIGIETGLIGIDCVELETGNVVHLDGCNAKEAVVGLCEGEFVLFFMGKSYSVQWSLDQQTVTAYGMFVVEKVYVEGEQI